MSKNTKVNRRTVMAEANALVKSAEMDRSTAVKQGYKIARLYALFAAGAIATVTFLKADGTERVARALPAKTGRLPARNLSEAVDKAKSMIAEQEKIPLSFLEAEDYSR